MRSPGFEPGSSAWEAEVLTKFSLELFQSRLRPHTTQHYRINYKTIISTFINNTTRTPRLDEATPASVSPTIDQTTPHTQTHQRTPLGRSIPFRYSPSITQFCHVIKKRQVFTLNAMSCFKHKIRYAHSQKFLIQ